MSTPYQSSPASDLSKKVKREDSEATLEATLEQPITELPTSVATDKKKYNAENPKPLGYYTGGW